MADDVKSDEQDCGLPPSKRKPDSCLADDQPKKSKSVIEPQLDSDVQQDGEAEIDRKGKGSAVTRDDKGKGKMVEDDENDSDDDDELVGGGVEDDDDDDNDSSGDEDDDSDLSDDPLAEVDLDNILPSRTRRRSSGGICLGKGKDNN